MSPPTRGDEQGVHLSRLRVNDAKLVSSCSVEIHSSPSQSAQQDQDPSQYIIEEAREDLSFG